MNRTTATTLAATVGLAAAAALGLAAPALAGADVSRADGEVARYTAEAPEGARARVQSIAHPDGRLTVTLHVRGLQPRRAYGAHAHVRPCGSTGAAAGPHFQFEVDPVQPSVDPAYANPANEIWLDLTTNPAGEGRATVVLDRQFLPGHRPQSVIIHATHTLTGPGVAGTAGARVACLTVPF